MTEREKEPEQNSSQPVWEAPPIESIDVKGGIALSERTIQCIRSWASSHSRENPAADTEPSEKCES